MDQMVLTVQQWLNQTYTGVDGWTPVTEDGITGQETVNALIEALQIEEGITSLSPNFGPTTTADFTPMQYTGGTTVSNKNYILQGGFWCKGIGPGAWNGIFDANTEQTVKNFQSAAGLAQDGVVTAMLMKALLNMGAYVLVLNGDAGIRMVQQSLNAKYNSYFGLIACDGMYERDTNTGLIYALQAEEGLSTSVANGTFGPTTTADCPTLSQGDSNSFVTILQWALYCNGFDPSGFDGSFGPGTESAVSSFQSYMGLTADGVAGVETWKALLISSGATSRSALACDTATILTSTTAQELASAGYKYVGRYLTGTVGSGSSETTKAVTSDELQAIFAAGLSAFIIYEDGGYELSYFTAAQGSLDAQTAIEAATGLNNGTQALPAGTTIYFAVDYDALDSDIQSNILPYFQALSAQFDVANYPGYVIGVYGTRNVCNQVWEAGYAEKCFVADMSTGWSGNLGFTIPSNWAFDQFVTRSVGSDGLQVDADGFSGRDSGINTLIDTATQGPSENQKYNARMAKIKDLINHISWLQNSALPTTGFEFDHEYRWDADLVYITYEASATLKTPGSDFMAYTVSNNTVNTSFSLQDSLLTLEIDSEAGGPGQQMGVALGENIGHGTLYVRIQQEATAWSVTLELESDEVDIPDTPFKTTLSQSVTFSFKYTLDDPTQPPAVSAVQYNMPNIDNDVAVIFGIAITIIEAASGVAEAATGYKTFSENGGEWPTLANDKVA